MTDRYLGLTGMAVEVEKGHGGDHYDVAEGDQEGIMEDREVKIRRGEKAYNPSDKAAKEAKKDCQPHPKGFARNSVACWAVFITVVEFDGA